MILGMYEKCFQNFNPQGKRKKKEAENKFLNIKIS